jgi:hypothetical protein
LLEGIAGARVSMFGPISAAYVILYFHHAHSLAQGLEGMRSELGGANLLEGMARREENHAYNEEMRARKKRKQA